MLLTIGLVFYFITTLYLLNKIPLITPKGNQTTLLKYVVLRILGVKKEYMP